MPCRSLYSLSTQSSTMIRARGCHTEVQSTEQSSEGSRPRDAAQLRVPHMGQVEMRRNYLTPSRLQYIKPETFLAQMPRRSTHLLKPPQCIHGHGRSPWHSVLNFELTIFLRLCGCSLSLRVHFCEPPIAATLFAPVLRSSVRPPAKETP